MIRSKRNKVHEDTQTFPVDNNNGDNCMVKRGAVAHTKKK